MYHQTHINHVVPQQLVSEPRFDPFIMFQSPSVYPQIYPSPLQNHQYNPQYYQQYYSEFYPCQQQQFGHCQQYVSHQQYTYSTCTTAISAADLSFIRDGLQQMILMTERIQENLDDINDLLLQSTKMLRSLPSIPASDPAPKSTIIDAPPASNQISSSTIPDNDPKIILQPSGRDSLEPPNPQLLSEEEISYPAHIDATNGSNTEVKVISALSFSSQTSSLVAPEQHLGEFYIDAQLKVLDASILQTLLKCFYAFKMFVKMFESFGFYDPYCIECKVNMDESNFFIFDPGGVIFASSGCLEKVVGPLVLLGFSCVTYYTSTLLANCYCYPDPVTGQINHVYIDAVRSYLGPTEFFLGGCAQYVNPRGTLVGYTITATISIIAVQRSNCFHKNRHSTDCRASHNMVILAFGVIQVFISQLPSLENITWLSVIAVATSFGYSFIGLGLCIAKWIFHGDAKCTISGTTAKTTTDRGWNILLALGKNAFAYTFADVLIEIQNTLKSPPAENKTMKRAAFYGIGMSSVFYFVVGCAGYTPFGNDSPGNILTGFGFYEPFWLVDVANICIIVHLLGAYQIMSFVCLDYEFCLSVDIIWSMHRIRRRYN